MTTSVLTPVARLLQGSLYIGATTNMDGKPLVTKEGEARTEFYFGIGIPKGNEKHWNETPWGQQIWAVGCEAFKNAPSLPSFAWKIVDGDSTNLNKNGVRPCDKEGWAGHWILNLSCGFAPKIYNRDGTQPMPQPDAILPGDYIQVYINVAGNKSSQSPGVYLNHNMVAFQGYGERITPTVDARSVGFGAAPLPAGASATPLAGVSTPLAGVSTPLAGVSTPPAGVSTPPAAATAAASQPHTAILNPESAPTPPLPTPPNPGATQRVMTAKANGATYDAFKAKNWSDEQLVADGYMLP